MSLECFVNDTEVRGKRKNAKMGETVRRDPSEMFHRLLLRINETANLSVVETLI